MKTLAQLKQERASKIKAQKALLDKRNAEKRDFTEDETKEFRELDKDIKDLDADIDQKKAEEAAEARSAELEGIPVDTALGNGEENELRKAKMGYSIHKAIRSQLGQVAFDGVEKEIHQETAKRAAEAGIALQGIAIPTPEKRADGQTVGEDGGAYGGNLVAEDLRSPIEFLDPKPVLRSVGARFLTGLRGNVAFPTDDGGIAASWEGEVDTVAPTKTAFGKKTMTPKRLAVNALISLQNLLQSSIDLERYTVETINKRVGLKIDEAGINGSGAGNVPLGILNAANVNTVVAGDPDGAAPTWDQIVDMESGVFSANADAATMAYVINTVTKGKLKKTKHQAGDLGYLMSKDNTVNGYKVGVSNLVPKDLSKGANVSNLSAGIFGDFDQFLIGQWGFYDMVADNITRKKDGYIEITLNTFLDMLVRQPGAFSVVKDWVI